MRLIETPCAACLAQIEKLYYEAFPVEEQKPFSVILEKNREGSMEILAAENNHKDFTGLAITARHRDLVMLDYFAISPCHRQGGVGSKVFRMLKERYAGQRFFLEIESTLVKAENAEQRKRRKALKTACATCPLRLTPSAWRWKFWPTAVPLNSKNTGTCTTVFSVRPRTAGSN